MFLRRVLRCRQPSRSDPLARDLPAVVRDASPVRADRLGFGKLPAGLIEVLNELEIVDGLDGAFEDGDGELLEWREVPDEREALKTSSEVIRGPIRA